MRTMPAYLIRHAWQILFVAVALLAAWIGSQYHPAAGLALMGIGAVFGALNTMFAAVATRAREIASHFDSVSVCFSKGLGAPVGSALVGSREFIARAHRIRKMAGGGMRQAGVLAAACLYALDHNVTRLAEDHDNAARLASGLAQIDEVTVQSHATNMVFAQLPPEHCQPLEAWLKERGILTQMVYSSRFVTHMDVTRSDIDVFVSALKAYFRAPALKK